MLGMVSQAKSIQFNMKVNKMKEKMDDKRKEVLDKGCAHVKIVI